MSTDTSEKGLEALIVRSLIAETGYAAGDPKDYDRDHAVDASKLLAFLDATQPDVVGTLGIGEAGPKRFQFLSRVQGVHCCMEQIFVTAGHGFIPKIVNLLFRQSSGFGGSQAQAKNHECVTVILGKLYFDLWTDVSPK